MSSYSRKAQPYLDAIAAGVFGSQAVRDWLLDGTPMESEFRDSTVLIDEQRTIRWRKKPTLQPFWANYHCGLDRNCRCRIEGSRGLESDAIFFLRNRAGSVLAIHLEFKHRGEPLRFGQPEAYPLRAACFARTHDKRPTLNAHDRWTTVIFCDEKAISDPRLSNFQRVITHSEARRAIASYPGQ
jgi:hypothetical protein